MQHLMQRDSEVNQKRPIMGESKMQSTADQMTTNAHYSGNTAGLIEVHTSPQMLQMDSSMDPNQLNPLEASD